MQPHKPPIAEDLHTPDIRRASATGASVLMGVAAVGALAAAATSLQMAGDAGPETVMLEIWRFAGLLLFSGLFALLAYRPMHYAGVWELVIVNKLTLTVMALGFAPEADGASGVALVDGILAGVLLTAYLLNRGWRAWPSMAAARPRYLQ